jgi:hypothetical protein
MKPYLISLTSEVEGLKENYINTLKNLEDSVEPIMVLFGDLVLEGEQCLYLDKVDVRHYHGTLYPGNLSRFGYFPIDLEDRMCIFTDSSDVIFQKPIPELEDKIYVSPEYDTWGKNNWWKQHLERFKFNNLEGEPIYCMGTWAMPFKKVIELLMFMDKNKSRFDGWEMSDQILFNWWLMNEEFEVHPTLFASLYDGYDKNHVLKTDKGFVNTKDELFCITHANGNKKELLIKEKL